MLLKEVSKLADNLVQAARVKFNVGSELVAFCYEDLGTGAVAFDVSFAGEPVCEVSFSSKDNPQLFFGLTTAEVEERFEKFFCMRGGIAA